MRRKEDQDPSDLMLQADQRPGTESGGPQKMPQLWESADQRAAFGGHQLSCNIWPPRQDDILAALKAFQKRAGDKALLLRQVVGRTELGLLLYNGRILLGTCQLDLSESKIRQNPLCLVPWKCPLWCFSTILT